MDIKLISTNTILTCFFPYLTTVFAFLMNSTLYRRLMTVALHQLRQTKTFKNKILWKLFKLPKTHYLTQR